MTNNTTNSQAASIADDPEFAGLLMDVLDDAITYSWQHGLPSGIPELFANIDAKLAQAFNDGAIEGRIHQRGIDDARIQAAESRLAEIQRGVEGLSRFNLEEEPSLLGTRKMFGVTTMTKQKFCTHGIYMYASSVLALLQPQGQADTSGLPG